MSKAFPSFGTGNKDITGGRVLLLFLLFAFSLYQFKSAGISGLGLGFAAVAIPLVLYLGFKYQDFFFWLLFVVNYVIMGLNRYGYVFAPITLITQGLEFLLLACILIDQNKYDGKYLYNPMCLFLMIWNGYLILQILNNTCDLPFSFDEWFVNANQMAFNLFFIYIIFSMMLTSPSKVMRFLRIWAILSITAALWAWRQQHFGWDSAEKVWLDTFGARTHIIGGSIRYFSYFSDAANFGCNIAGSSMAFFVIALTTRLKRDKLLFLIAGVLSLYGVFASGTRTALFCFIVAGALYVVLSKSVKIAVPIGILGAVFIFILAFTKIGDNNMQIRRMRTAFNKDDASLNVRDMNKEALAKYMKDAPFGFGISIKKVPANHKYAIAMGIAPDSTYVHYWQYLGIVGTVTYAIVNILILAGGACIALFRLRNKALIGVAAGLCCAFAAINVGGYANRILTQYPNAILFYGGMAIVYLLPAIEQDYIAYEEKQHAIQEEKKRLRLEKLENMRVKPWYSWIYKYL